MALNKILRFELNLINAKSKSVLSFFHSFSSAKFSLAFQRDLSSARQLKKCFPTGLCRANVNGRQWQCQCSIDSSSSLSLQLRQKSLEGKSIIFTWSPSPPWIVVMLGYQMPWSFRLNDWPNWSELLSGWLLVLLLMSRKSYWFFVEIHTRRSHFACYTS